MALNNQLMEPLSWACMKDADFLLATELAHLEKAVQTLAIAADKRQLLTATIQGIQVRSLSLSSGSALGIRLIELREYLEEVSQTFLIFTNTLPMFSAPQGSDSGRLVGYADLMASQKFRNRPPE